MSDIQIKNFFQKKYKTFGISVPKVHFVLGSLFGSTFSELSSHSVFSNWKHKGRIDFSEVPELSHTSAPSHQGHYEYFVSKKKPELSICFQSGRLHGYEDLHPKKVVQTVTGPGQTGTNQFVLTNISGALKKELSVGSVVAITDHINFTGHSPLCGLTESYFVDMKNAYDPEMTKSFQQELEKQNRKSINGVYVGVLGPQYETPAEVQLFANWSGDIVGMSTIWEVIALRYLNAKVCAFSVVSNAACGVGSSVEIQPELLQPVFMDLIKAMLVFAEKQ